MSTTLKHAVAACMAVLVAFVVRSAQAEGSFLPWLSSHEARVESSPFATGGDIILRIPWGVDDHRYVHVFTNATEQTFMPAYSMSANILLVGGGGSGGAAAGYDGGGGGGGGGGFLQLNGVRIDAGRYRVAAGAGGVGRKSNVGENGGVSRIWADSDELWTALEAGGGGGGGSISAGQDGSSGGGGSIANAGGSSSFEGQGYAGGTGGSNSGGGGGGAGGAGYPGGDGWGGKGGAGLSSEIFGTLHYFGGGGGGGGQNGYGGVGGTGGGGSASSLDRGESGRPGVDGLGGGGSASVGDTSSQTRPAGGKGGDGIVVISYSESGMALVRPVSASVTYDGAAHDFAYDRKGAFVYAVQTGVDETTLEPVWAAADDAVRTDAGTYVFRVSLKDGWYWGNDEADRSPVVVTGCIEKASNPVSGLYLASWSAGHEPAVPTCSVAFGADTLVYDYSSSYDHWPEEPGTTAVPDEPGVYYVRAFVPEAANWKASSAIAEFVVARNETDLFGDHMTVTVVAPAAETLADFPVLVRISEAACPGFRYGRLTYPRTGEDLRFFWTDAEGVRRPVPHEIDVWDPSGESLVWVLVPVLPPEGTTLTVYWRADGKLPTNDPTAVWKDYIGVWHMNLDENGRIRDATGHGLDAVVDDLTVTNVAGVCGLALSAGGNALGSGGSVVIPNWEEAFPCGGSFAFSGWMRFESASPIGGLFFNKKYGNGWNKTEGWSFGIDSKTGELAAYGNGTQKVSCALADKNAWHALSLVATDGSAVCGLDGVAFGDASSWAIVASTNAFELMRAGHCVDEVRLSARARSAAWLAAEQVQSREPGAFCTPGDVYFEGVRQNYWLSRASVEPSVWGEDDDPYEPGVVTPAEAKYGTVLTTWRPSGSTAETPLADGLPTVSGVYELVCRVPATESLSGIETTARFRITGSQPQEDLSAGGEDASSGGRILLMNGDRNPAAPVYNQGYFDSDPRRSTFWETLEEDALNDHVYNLKNGVSFMMWTRNKGKRLWYLQNCRQGNTYPYMATDPLVATNYPSQLHLPYSETSMRISSHNSLPIRPWDVGQIVMRNVEDVQVLSPCYEDGIGTVYFDVAPGWLTDVPLAGINETQKTPDACAREAGYSLVLEIATDIARPGGEPYGVPTDDKIDVTTNIVVSTIDPETGETVERRETRTLYGARANWRPVEMTAILVRGDEVVDQERETAEAGAMARDFVSTNLALAVWTNDTARLPADRERKLFYRVRAKIDCYTPCRFRLRRVGTYGEADGEADGKGVILVDNVIASFPVMRADLSNYGTFDPDRGGKRILGQEGAWQVPFPSATSDEIWARAKPVYSYGKAVPGVKPEDFVLSAQMHYRWRYLDQAVDPWKTVELDTGTFAALAPLALDGRGHGDIEYYFTLDQETPFYSYVDYSGCERDGEPLGVPGYTEELSAVTNRAEATDFQSGGRDWFVRLREGESAYEDVRLIVSYDVYFDKSYDYTVVVTNEMELVDDRTWRGLFRQPQLPANDPFVSFGDTVRYRFEAVNEQVPMAVEWATNVTRWCARADGPELPYSDVLVPTDEPEWHSVVSDRGSGYLCFLVEESNLSLTVLHADYQDFNGWTDANRGDRRFVGWSSEGEGMAGTSASTRSVSQTFASWGTTPSTNPLWSEKSDTSTRIEYGLFTTFSGQTLNSWQAAQSMYVHNWYRNREAVSSTDYALQLRDGSGSWTYENASAVPRGLEQITFDARVGQVLEFGDIAYYDGSRKMDMHDYTFVAGAAFDENGCRDFQGAASFSLVAYYMPNVGCYEARLHVDAKGKGVDAGNKDEPVPGSAVLSLYRWRATPGSGKVNAECLAVISNIVTAVPLTGATYSGVDGQGLEKTRTYGYLPIYLSVSNAADEVWIKCGVRDCYKVSKTVGSLTKTDLENSYLGMMPDENEFAGNFRSICYRDAKPDRLTYGTYGVLSGNSPAVFLKPTFVDRPEGQIVDYPYCYKTNGQGRLSEVLRFNPERNKQWRWRDYETQLPIIDWVPPMKPNPITGQYEPSYVNAQYVGFEGNRRACADEMREDLWVFEDGRNAFFETASETFGVTAADHWGVYALTPTQTVRVLASPYNRAQWKQLYETTVGGFNNQTFKYDESTGLHRDLALYSTDDYQVRFECGASEGDSRADLVLDNVGFSQWRGADWFDSVNEIPTGLVDGGLYTNFTFNSCWLEKGVLKMSAKRTAVGDACAIYSPLFDGGNGRGRGLGMFMFKFRNAQANTRLLVQVATNLTWDANWYDPSASDLEIDRLSFIDWEDLNGQEWVTVTNFTFESLPQPVNSGTRACYVGLHGVRGVMRLVVDPSLVESVSDPKFKVRSEFGEIDIVELYCRDEPDVDQGCWWGWNFRTLGPEATGPLGPSVDGEGKMYLPDLTTDITRLGQSAALNDSLSSDVVENDAATYRQHQPFIQTPRLAANVTPGVITFKARRYDTASAQPAQVTLYGSENGSEYWYWTRLASFAITNDLYETYSITLPPGEQSRCFRLAVTGVPGVTDEWIVGGNRPPDGGYASPVRVLIDEVCIREAVRARVAFRNVGAFRALPPSDLANALTVPGVPGEAEQPLCGEYWGVQCEVYAASLPEEIDFANHPPKVRLHWFPQLAPWGFENWRTNAWAKHEWLEPASDNPLVFRSSHATCPAAVVEPSERPGTVVQYQLEVVYWEKDGLGPYTNFMNVGEWKRPSWYRPLDLNRDRGSNVAFSAYTILDTVSPHWAWVNEVNLLGELDVISEQNTEYRQFVEVAAPAEADITGWSVKLLQAKRGRNGGSVVTNVLGRFGVELPVKKRDLIGMASNMVFHVIGAPTAREHGLSEADGTLDAMWEGRWYSGGIFDNRDGRVLSYEPVGIVLERASGILEHEITVIGTNIFEGTDFDATYRDEYDPAKIARFFNERQRESEFFSVGSDDGGTNNTRGVFAERGGAADVWNRTMALTPGRINEGQTIPSVHPTPNTSTFFVFANLADASGSLGQKTGAATDDPDAYQPRNLLIVLPKGGPGTNIVYRAATWFDLGSVTTNAVALAPSEWGRPGSRLYEIRVGQGASNDVTVVAAATVNQTLKDNGIGDDDPYKDAIVDWLTKGRNHFGDPFAKLDSETIERADVLDRDGEVTGQLTLKQMYWLDMDPTIGSSLVFQGLVTETAHDEVYVVPTPQGDQTVTNVLMTVKLMISNRVDKTAWAPYVLRGLGVGETSATADPAGWTAATFKPTGFFDNGLTSMDNDNDWMPLRWFVFGCDPERKVSTSFRPRGDPKGEFTADIAVMHPLSPQSVAYWSGWGDWLEKHPGVLPTLTYKWAIDERRKPVEVEMLKPDSYYYYFESDGE